MKTKFFTILLSFLFLSSFSQDINNFTFECNGETITVSFEDFGFFLEEGDSIFDIDFVLYL